MNLENIRNFCIIAHIDHGKSTLADRLLEITGTIDKREMKHGQMLDTMELEQERGITIKLQPVKMNWKGYELNIIDTPGHVDFQYEVSRSLASVEGALLIVDATQGIEAQTLSNVYMAIENDLDIIPIINKIDLPAADFDKVAEEIISLLGCDISEIIGVSAKTGENVETVLEEVIKKISPPKVFSEKNPENDELKALVFDSQYDSYRGVVSYVKVFQGEIKKGDTLHFLNTDKKIEALDVGYFSPSYISSDKIGLGSVGYVVTGLKTIRDAKVGDTVWKPEMVEGPKARPEDAKAIEGFGEVVPFIYAGIFAMDSSEYPLLKDSMEKLVLNDSALTVEQEVSPALGHGYRCGFLGLLHLDIVKERLMREFGMDVIMTSPQVTYRVVLSGDKTSEYSRLSSELIEDERGHKHTRILVSNPEELPSREKYLYIEEPIAKVEIITPEVYVGSLMQLSQERRGIFKNQQFIDSDRVMLTYELPMNELIGDFYDEIKSLSSGYASLNYEFIRFSESDLVKLEVVIADEKVEALAFICHKEQARYIGGKICLNLKHSIPKALFTIKIQAVVGSEVVGRENISAMRKDVTAKLYGGDISRKRKLLDKQKKGKKKLKQFGKVSLPSEAFVNLLKK
ncbi:elongation factor 4 [Candidatus Gracilibacteria bacterium]|nr:MAG: elongation factor 4 [Candidatus Gracilibacteria bacterium]PIE85615.1 MAG: elongation factor 4 [Candidatus Gracilibacteria bacterium]